MDRYRQKALIKSTIYAERNAAMLGALGADWWVVASNTPVKVREYARSLQTAGYPVSVCDGVNDEVEINDAINVLGKNNISPAGFEPDSGGLLKLSWGKFKSSAAITSDKTGITIRGMGNGYDATTATGVGSGPHIRAATEIEVQCSLADSVRLEGWFNNIENLFINGNDKASQVYVNSPYGHIKSVSSMRHGSYNLYGLSGPRTVSKCYFFGKPVRVSGNTWTFNDATYFNGIGVDKCLIIDGDAINVRDCTFETYYGRAIDAGTLVTSKAMNIIGNGFESAGSCSYVIDMQARTGNIIGNIVSSNDPAERFALITNAIDVVVEANDAANKPVYVNSDLSCTGLRVKHFAKIEYNGYGTAHDLTDLKIQYPEGRAIIESVTDPSGLTGTYKAGDHWISLAPAASRPPGKFCVASGGPGTWASEGSLSA